MNQEEPPLEPASLTLSSRNFLPILFLAQFFLLINGTYLYNISAGAASLYLYAPSALIIYLLTLSKLDNGRPITWEMLENSLIAKKDFLSKYLRKADWSVSYFSLGIQLIYFTFSVMFTSVVLMLMIKQGYLSTGVLDPIQARTAIIYHSILVSPSETLIFQAIIPLWVSLTFAKVTSKVDMILVDVEKRTLLIYIISQLIFGIYHISAYGGNWTSIAVAVGLGMVFLYSARSYGIPFAIGVHLSWNLAVLGVLTPALGG